MPLLKYPGALNLHAKVSSNGNALASFLSFVVVSISFVKRYGVLSLLGFLFMISHSLSSLIVLDLQLVKRTFSFYT